jgi:competence protein ComEC
LKTNGTRGQRRFIAAVVFSAVFVILAVTSPAAGQTLRIYHIDVDQADAILLVSPDGQSLLIDCGEDNMGDRVKAVMDQAGVEQIDYFVCSHYHTDHYGGIDELIEDEGVTVVTAYDRGDKECCLPEGKHDDRYFKDYMRALGHRAEVLGRGYTIELGDVDVTCLAHGSVVLSEPDPVTHGHNENDMSIALLVQYAGFRYFTAGDLLRRTERKVAELDQVQDVDMYKSNHHGSNTSSRIELMEALSPSAIVISNGSHHYAHPRRVILDRYAELESEPVVFQTNKLLIDDDRGGNVPDAFIGDLDAEGADGTILVTVDGAAGTYEVSYRDTSVAFDIKARATEPPDVVIVSLLPNPDGGAAVERLEEEVTLRNDSDGTVSLIGWTLIDTSTRIWSLSAAGDVEPGQSVTIRRGGMAMALNNSGDHIYLRDPNANTVDEYSYASSTEGDRIHTGK